MGASRERPALAAMAWLWTAACWAALADAQSPSTPNAASDAPVPFDIPAQPMASALNTWAVQANAQIFVDPGPVAHLAAPAVRGTLRPRQALRALLAHSNLQITQGSGGVFVIKPRAAVASTPAAEPAQPASLPGAPPPPITVPAQGTARASDGPWLVGLYADFAIDRGDARGGGSASLRGEYFINDHLGAALALTSPRTHSFDVGPAARASAELQSSAVSLRYHFLPAARVDPFLGAGIDVTVLYGASGVRGLDRTTVGPMAEAGVGWRLAPHWLLDAEVNWAPVRPESDIHLDPVRFDLGFAYRF